MYLLIDHNGQVVPDGQGGNHAFDSAEDAQEYADSIDEIDWLIVKFVSFT